MVIAGQAIRAAAPLAMGHAAGVAYTIDPEIATPDLSIIEPTSGFDKDTDDQHLLIFNGLPTEAGRNALPKGMRYVSVISGDSTTPPTFPFVATPAYTMYEGQNITTDRKSVV